MIDTTHGMQCIVNIKDCASGITEYLFNALIDKRSDDHLGSRQHLHGLPHCLTEKMCKTH
ncbi:Uncharacterised protein [Shigella sonnei]|nr:Uncharacterised protein [Shigella sonnei]